MRSPLRPSSMSDPQQMAVDQLNRIIALTPDGYRRYGNAGKHENLGVLALTLPRIPEQRATYGGWLLHEVLVRGGTAEHERSDSLGFLLRTWMNLESVVSSGSTAAILEACITGEAAALKEYDCVLLETCVAGDVYNVLCLQEQET